MFLKKYTGKGPQTLRKGNSTPTMWEKEHRTLVKIHISWPQDHHVSGPPGLVRTHACGFPTENLSKLHVSGSSAEHLCKIHAQWSEALRTEKVAQAHSKPTRHYVQREDSTPTKPAEGCATAGTTRRNAERVARTKSKSAPPFLQQEQSDTDEKMRPRPTNSCNCHATSTDPISMTVSQNERIDLSNTGFKGTKYGACHMITSNFEQPLRCFYTPLKTPTFNGPRPPNRSERAPWSNSGFLHLPYIRTSQCSTLFGEWKAVKSVQPKIPDAHRKHNIARPVKQVFRK